MIPLFKVYMSKDAADAAKEVLDSGYIGEGERVKVFESAIGEYLGTDYVATTNSGTSALHLALRLLKDRAKTGTRHHGLCYAESCWDGCDENTEVLTTPLTCFATNAPILANGLKIKWVDVDEFSLNMDLDDLERKLSPTTRIIMVMHWGGMPTNLNRIKEIQNKCFDLYGFRPAVIEDCAHSFGTKFDGKYLGNHGNICCYSFQAIKHVTSVDGGCIVSPYDKLYRRAKLLRWYGMDREGSAEMRCYNDFDEWGYKFHMNDVNAAIGFANLQNADWIIEKHQENAEYYRQNIKISVQKPPYWASDESSYWLYTLGMPNATDFNRKMKEHGIHTNHVHERNDKYSCVREFKAALPALDQLDNKISCIPVGWWVTPEDREYIVDKINEGW